MSAITSVPSGVGGGSMNLISTQTASSSSTVSFTSGIDSTYKEYIFKFYDIHPATDNTYLTFQADTGTNTNYNQTITSSFFKSLHNESGGTSALSYDTSSDLAQSTSFQHLSRNVGNDNDQSIAGTLHIFDPSNTTFVKHFIATTNVYTSDDYSIASFVAGYFNTTTALTRFQFKMESGNIDSGIIKLYGIS
tara:strand:+ start:90 stop:665 length:576 start_codon:yes stop_codon:yes gene_type:complete